MASTPPFSPSGNKERREDEWSLVIKVKFGATLRRFSAYVHQNLMIIEYDMNQLKAKISSLFKFGHDVALVLTYTDEDGDVVALDNDEELRDAVINQRLNPLRINVELKPNSVDGSDSRTEAMNISDESTNTATPAHQVHNGLAQLETELKFAVKDALKSVPEPIRGILTNVSHDVVQTASSTPIFAELLSCLSKMRLSNVSQSSHEQTGNPSGMSSGVPPSVVNFNTVDEPNVSSDPQNPLSRVLHEVPDNVQKMHEFGNLNQTLGSITIAPEDISPGMLKEQEGCDVHHAGKSAVAARPPSMSSDNQGVNNTWENFDKPNPYLTPMFEHVNSSTNMWPATSQCPFGIMPSFIQGVLTSHDDVLGNRHADASAFPCHSPMLHPYRRSYSSYDRLPRTFHRGVICDGCGMHPIMGPRYKSTVKENYDLCSTCFRDMGKETEYTRIDWSAFRFPKAMKDYHKLYRSRTPSTPAFCNRMKSPRPKLASCFIRDVTVWDGTVMRPCSSFTKIWRMYNNGTIAWPSGAQLVWVRGDHLGSNDSAELEISEGGFPVGQELDIAVDFVAPSVPGRYTSYWQMASPSGQKFGEEVWVIIQVDLQPASSACGAHAFINLNLPPESIHHNCPVIIDVDAEPLHSIPVEPDAEKLLEELVKPVTHDVFNSTQPDGTSVLPPSNDTSVSSSMDSPLFLIDVPASSSPVSNPPIDNPETLPPFSYPLIDNTETLPPFSYPLIDNTETLPPFSYPLIDIPSSSNPPDTIYPQSDALTDDNVVEQTLLKELGDMGFNQMDLNKEILRQNQYDLEQSVEDLCGFAEWDPLLKELHEMGFIDRNLNRKLLSKNGGSIKRAVLDLVNGKKGE